jgi:hypothetical protein
MSDILIRKVGPALKRQIEESAHKHGRSLSAEAKILIERGLAARVPSVKMGTFLFSLLEDRYRGDDLVFKRNDLASPPPFFFE